MIRNKPYLELNFILNAFPEASNAGYAVLPLLLKLCIDYGMASYEEALNAWKKSNLKKAKVYTSIEKAIEDKVPIIVQWGGKDYEKRGDTLIVGIKETLKSLEYNVLADELKRAGDTIKKDFEEKIK